jgi:hypothetical protein
MEVDRRIKRDGEIVRLYEEGIGCERIAQTVRLKSARVRRILKAKGYDLGGKPFAHPIGQTIWEREHINLRAAIAKRASDAARTRLKEIAAEQGAVLVSPSINTTHSSSGGVVRFHLAEHNSQGADQMHDATFAQDIH